ncbi:MAG: hypothetical protein PHR06_04575 [Candidatus Cloacimonetes bacterium]|nr:hypothetical protein [Candidatus Cloacimonadota bacterium]
MIDESKIILETTIDIENEDTPFGKRYGGDVFTLTDEDIENLRNGRLIGLDVQNEYISYLKYKPSKTD